jgi:outer membrane receptor protein involved in Fe transport
VIGLLILSAVAAGSGWAQSMLVPQEVPSAAADEAITLSLPRSMSATERDELIGALVRHGATVIVTDGSTESAAATGGIGSSVGGMVRGLDVRTGLDVFVQLGDQAFDPSA